MAVPMVSRLVASCSSAGVRSGMKLSPATGDCFLPPADSTGSLARPGHPSVRRSCPRRQGTPILTCPGIPILTHPDRHRLAVAATVQEGAAGTPPYWKGAHAGAGRVRPATTFSAAKPTAAYANRPLSRPGAPGGPGANRHTATLPPAPCRGAIPPSRRGPYLSTRNRGVQEGEGEAPPPVPRQAGEPATQTSVPLPFRVPGLALLAARSAPHGGVDPKYLPADAGAVVVKSDIPHGAPR